MLQDTRSTQEIDLSKQQRKTLGIQGRLSELRIDDLSDVEVEGPIKSVTPRKLGEVDLDDSFDDVRQFKIELLRCQSSYSEDMLSARVSEPKTREKFIVMDRFALVIGKWDYSNTREFIR